MTNRDYLNTLPNDKFSDLVLAKSAEFHCNNLNPALYIFDITDGTKIDFEEWLGQEYVDETKVGTSADVKKPKKSKKKNKRKRKYFRKCGVCGDRHEQSEMIRANCTPNGWICEECYGKEIEHDEILGSIEEW